LETTWLETAFVVAGGLLPRRHDECQTAARERCL